LLRRIGVHGKRNPRKTIRQKGINSFGKHYSKEIDLMKTSLLAALPTNDEGPRLLTGKSLENPVSIYTKVLFDHNNLGHYKSPGSFMSVNLLQFITVIAKIAHAEAIRMLGTECFEPSLTNLIRGIDDKWMNVIGKCQVSSLEPIAGSPVVSVQIHDMLPPHHRKLLGRVRILEGLGGPIYDVLIGHLLPNQLPIPKSVIASSRANNNSPDQND
jgi:hypothetical protein